MVTTEAAHSSRGKIRWLLELRPTGPVLAILLGLAVLGIAVVLSLTRDGAGASGDSAFYVMGARNLLAGNGYARITGSGDTQPITGFPPVFSIVLAGLGLFGTDGYQAARYLNAALFGANLLLVGGLTCRISDSRWAAGIAAALVLSSMTVLQLHSWVMSEPLYITLLLLSAGVLAIGAQHGEPRLYLLAGLLAGAASLTRYVGIGLIGVGFAFSLLVGDPQFGRRARRAGVFLAAAVLPVAWWLLGSASGEGAVANRAIIYHPMDADLLDQYQAELIAWAFARQLPVAWRPRAVLAALVAAVGPIHFVARWFRERGRRRSAAAALPSTLPWLLGGYLLAHLGILAANSLFLDAATTVSAVARYLAPAYVVMVILSVSTTARLVREFESAKYPAYLAVGLAGILIALHGRNTAIQLSEPGLDLGYVGVKRDFPELVEGLIAIEPGRPIISNNPELVYVLVERPARPIPARNDPYLDRVREDYASEVETMRDLLDAGAVLVIFGKPDADAQAFLDSLRIEPIAWFNTAMFYSAADAAEG